MRCDNCRAEFEVGDLVFSDGVSEHICGGCVRDIVDDMLIQEVARLLGYSGERFSGDDEEEEAPVEAPKQIPGQMDIWGGSLNE